MEIDQPITSNIKRRPIFNHYTPSSLTGSSTTSLSLWAAGVAEVMPGRSCGKPGTSNELSDPGTNSPKDMDCCEGGARVSLWDGVASMYDIVWL